MNLSLPRLWELHPTLVHFPIAFLLGGVALLLWDVRRPDEAVRRAATGLLLAGTSFGWLAAAAGGLAYFTVPAHTEEGHYLMYWHLAVGIAMLAAFTWLTVARRRRRTQRTTMAQGAAAVFAALLLTATGYLGGMIVYRHGAGVHPEILAPEIRAGHSHGGDPSGNGHDHHGSNHEH
jgi:uncharacterized membrane protein